MHAGTLDIHSCLWWTAVDAHLCDAIFLSPPDRNISPAHLLRATSTVDRRAQEHTVSIYKCTATLLLHITTGQLVHMHKHEHKTRTDP